MAKAQRGGTPWAEAQSTALSQGLCRCARGCETLTLWKKTPHVGPICQASSKGIFLGTPRSEPSTMPGRDSSIGAICFLTQGR